MNEDAYVSEDAEKAHKFVVMIWYSNGNPCMRSFYIDANCYADAVATVAPGNDVAKIEVISA